VEVAVGALGLAERDLHIQSEAHGQSKTLAQGRGSVLTSLAKRRHAKHVKGCKLLSLVIPGGFPKLEITNYIVAGLLIRKDGRRWRFHATTKKLVGAYHPGYFFSDRIVTPATITGTVKGPDGAPFEGAFVQAQNTKTRMAFIVLTDSQGHYRVEKVPAGEYQLTSRATGYRGDPRPGVVLTADQDASFDFALQKAPIRWNELSIYQAETTAPASTGKDTLFAQCFVCHGFQTRMASARRDADGWQERVQYMRDAMHFSLSWRFDDKMATDVASFLNSSFGPTPRCRDPPPISRLQEYDAQIHERRDEHRVRGI